METIVKPAFRPDTHSPRPVVMVRRRGCRLLRVLLGPLVVLCAVAQVAGQHEAGRATGLARMLRRPTSRTAATTMPVLPPKEAARACVATADELMNHGHRREAIALYERARTLDPKRTHVCRILAVLYDQDGQDASALAEYEAAIEATPDDAELLNDFGCFHNSRGDYASAEQWFRKSLAVKPQQQRAWTNLGMALGNQGKYGPSYDAFVKAVGPAAAHSNVGMLLAQRGQWDDARRAFRNALAIQPELPQARAVLNYLDSPPRENSGPREPVSGVGGDDG